MPSSFFRFSIAFLKRVCYTWCMDIKLGKYRHFKGGEYEVLHLAKDSETLETMVVYRALYGEGGVWVRPAKMWNEMVEREGKTYKRFTFIG